MLPYHTPTHLHLAQKSLHDLRDGRGCSHSLYNLQTFSMTSGFTPLSELQKPGRKCYVLYLLSHHFLELSSPELRQMGGEDRGDAWEGGG